MFRLIRSAGAGACCRHAFAAGAKPAGLPRIDHRRERHRGRRTGRLSGRKQVTLLRSLLSRATPFLKVAFAVALLTWMARSGKLSLSQVGKAWEHWPILMGAMALMYLQIAVTSWRWKYLL